MTATHATFTVTRGPSGVVVTLRGALDLDGAVRIGAVLGDLIDGQGNLALAVDLSEVEGMHEAALGVFEVASRLVNRRGGELSIGAPSAGIPLMVPGSAGHRVEFYEGDASLAKSVCGYLEPALRADDAAIVVATSRHRELFRAALADAGVDLEAARQGGRYVALDAEETLARFMHGDAPDPVRFEAVLGGLIADAGRSGRSVRVYGEMVAVLWAEGNVAAAVALEDLWNDLACSEAFSLLCGYPTTTFDSPATTGLFRTICQQHAAP